MGKTILIVEDNELNMKLFRDLLEAHGFETLETKNGEEALKLARDHQRLTGNKLHVFKALCSCFRSERRPPRYRRITMESVRGPAIHGLVTIM